MTIRGRGKKTVYIWGIGNWTATLQKVSEGLSVEVTSCRAWIRVGCIDADMCSPDGTSRKDFLQ